MNETDMTKLGAHSAEQAEDRVRAVEACGKSATPRTEYIALRLSKASAEVTDPDLGVQMRMAATELRQLETDLAAANERVRVLGAAVDDVKRDCEMCDWHCTRCGQDYGMTDTDLYLSVTRYLAATAPKGEL